MKNKYVAFYAANCEYEEFETYKEAEEWLIDYDHQDGVSEETMNGCNYIAKITHVSKFTKTDLKENYHVHDENCPEDCTEEEWPYSDEWDYVGNVTMEPITQETQND